ncbi:uncharacterized protein FOMMEDRAFT_159022 [Fomitiporia mediterranea MF3/22]|uniref:uncharacterized protein n=1 Tax=Fomitiporia mediterranea (strain MF3/22) TaxID=694068 RepID=UPI0004407EB1|nr:uncharacterized protein FOMMEDRAFT_159022 [Fomitiporia mediterranea MF3/22]EJD00347.1 hypothetical protein FOMMEDRAFT_159022 [Fomitiporia mediterranea MF3/22]
MEWDEKTSYEKREDGNAVLLVIRMGDKAKTHNATYVKNLPYNILNKCTISIFGARTKGCTTNSGFPSTEPALQSLVKRAGSYFDQDRINARERQKQCTRVQTAGLCPASSVDIGNRASRQALISIIGVHTKKLRPSNYEESTVSHMTSITQIEHNRTAADKLNSKHVNQWRKSRSSSSELCGPSKILTLTSTAS